MKARDFFDDYGEAMMGCAGIFVVFLLVACAIFLGFKRLRIKERQVEVLEKMVNKDTGTIHKVIDFSDKL